MTDLTKRKESAINNLNENVSTLRKEVGSLRGVFDNESDNSVNNEDEEESLNGRDDTLNQDEWNTSTRDIS